MNEFENFDSTVEPWLADPVAMLENVRGDMKGVEVIFRRHGEGAVTKKSALFHRESIGAALLNGDGAVVLASEVFLAEHAERYLDIDLVTKVVKGNSPKVVPVALDNGTGQSIPAIFVYASAKQAEDWRLPMALAEQQALHQSAVVVVTTISSARASPLEAACNAFGLSGLQMRVAIATLKIGSIKGAASHLRITYQTAREAMSEGMKRVGVTRLPALVSKLASLSFGVMPDNDINVAMLFDLWGITPRQSSLAALIVSGLSRGEAAKALGLSEAVAKKELDHLYTALGVTSSAALARIMVEAQALQWVTQATGGQIGFIEADKEPLRFAFRADGTRVAWSDYGPASGKPVLIVHSSMTSRFVSRRLVRAFHSRGFRPIAIDRPGFGLTDLMPGLIAGKHDPFATSVHDVALVARQAKFARIDVVARGGAHHVLALHRAYPSLLGRVLLTNPDPDSKSDPRRQGTMGAVKELYVRRPGLVRLMAKALSGQISYEKMPRLLAKMMEGSPPDEAAIAEPDIFEDYFRSLRHFATGRYEGYVNEQIAHATHSRPSPAKGTKNWHFIVGEYDTLYDPDFVIAYWREILPEAGWQKVSGAGRLVAMTHSDLVAELLAQSGAE
jgi:pimeloyl-ACP methyl ester carboxylesterase/DNA-binding CsgD family transcriptional regulator